MKRQEAAELKGGRGRGKCSKALGARAQILALSGEEPWFRSKTKTALRVKGPRLNRQHLRGQCRQSCARWTNNLTDIRQVPMFLVCKEDLSNMWTVARGDTSSFSIVAVSVTEDTACPHGTTNAGDPRSNIFIHSLACLKTLLPLLDNRCCQLRGSRMVNTLWPICTIIWTCCSRSQNILSSLFSPASCKCFNSG